MTYPGQYTRCPSLSSLTEERARELCRVHGAGSSVSHQSSGVSRVRAAPHCQQTSRQRAPATCHGERHTIATTRVVLYPTIRQWNGCPSDKRQLVCVSYMLFRGQTGGRCGRGTRRASELRQPRAPACSRLGGRTRDKDRDKDRNGCRRQEQTEELHSAAFFRHFHKISHTLGCYRITVSTRTSLITSLSRLLTVE